MIKYILKSPVKRPANFFKYGSGFYAILRAADAGLPTAQMTLDTFIPVLLAYLQTKYLPPTSVWDVLIPIGLGALFAGLKWRAS